MSQLASALRFQGITGSMTVLYRMLNKFIQDSFKDRNQKVRFVAPVGYRDGLEGLWQSQRIHLIPLELLMSTNDLKVSIDFGDLILILFGKKLEIGVSRDGSIVVQFISFRKDDIKRKSGIQLLLALDDANRIF